VEDKMIRWSKCKPKLTKSRV